MPSTEATALEVIEAELPFHILITSFGPPPLLDMAYRLLLGEVFGHAEQVELVGLGLAILPLHEEPQRLVFCSLGPFIRDGENATHGESRRHGSLGPFPPGGSPKSAAPDDLPGQLGNRHRLALTPVVLVQAPHLGVGLDGDGILQPQVSERATELGGIAVDGIHQHDSRRNAVGDGTPYLRECELELGPEVHIVWDARFSPLGGFVAPFLRNIQFEVDREMRRGGGDGETDSDLTVGNFPSGARMWNFENSLPMQLWLHADRWIF